MNEPFEKTLYACQATYIMQEEGWGMEEKIPLLTRFYKHGGGKVWPVRKWSHFNIERRGLRVEILGNSFCTKI